MAKGKQRAWHVLDGLYRDVEDARRHHEHGTNPDGARAYERWLEILEIAEWKLDELAEGNESDSTDLEGQSAPSADSDGPDEGRQQLQLPGCGELGADVPRGTLQRDSEPVPLVGTVDGMTDAELKAELERRNMTPTGKQRFNRGRGHA